MGRAKFTIRAVCEAFEPMTYLHTVRSPERWGYCDKCGLARPYAMVELDGKPWYLCSPECAMTLYGEYLRVFWIKRRATKARAA